MTMLRELLTTWEKWSARAVLIRALDNATSGDSRERITISLANTPAVSALDALRDSTELLELLRGWQWQAMYAARREGATWEQVGVATASTGQRARAAYAANIDRHESVVGRNVSHYRAVL